MKHLIVMGDRRIGSGVGSSTAIRSLTLSRFSNDGQELNLGSACAAMAEVVLWDSTGTFCAAGEMEIYAQEGDKTTLLGYFTPETPKKTGANTFSFTAYDRMLRFDRDLTAFLTGLEGWPYTMQQLLELVCQACGVEAEGRLRFADRPVLRFLQAVTGRQLIKWLAEANGTFACITPEGRLAFRPYEEGGEVHLPLKTFRPGDYATAPICRVCIRQTEEDMGVSYPEEGEAYTITANPLLAGFHQGELLELAKSLHAVLAGITYTPVKAEVFGGHDLQPGKFYTFFDQKGNPCPTVIFSAVYRRGVTAVESTGSPNRSGASAMAGKDPVKVTQGRVAELRAGLEGISTALRETELDLETVKTREAAIDLTLGSITSQVRSTETTLQGFREQLTRVEQNATALEIAIGTKAEQGSVQELSRHFIFDGEGLTLRSGSGMGLLVSEERILFTGGSSANTEIRPHQMKSTNLRIDNRLELGRFTFFPRTNGNLSLRCTSTGE